MSTYKSLAQVIHEVDYWLRLATVQHGLVKQQLLCILHNKNNHGHYQGLPEDPVDLYTALSTTHKGAIDKLTKKRVLKQDQLELLLPSDGSQKTDSQAFDITLIVLLIINCTTLPPPVDGWYSTPLDSDISVAANVLRSRAWRNFLNHTDANSIDQVIFDQKWKKAIAILQGLGGSVTDMGTLKTISLDPKHEAVMKSLMDFNQWEIATLQNRVDDLETLTNDDFENFENTINVKQRLDQQDQRLEQQAQQMITDNGETKQHKNLMTHQLQHLSKEVEQLKKLKEESFFTGSCPNIQEKCCNEVLMYVAGELNEDWCDFLQILIKKSGSNKEIQTDSESGTENINNYFKSNAFQVKWNDLKETLLNMEKGEIVDHIEKTFLYTGALQLASNKLKEQYMVELIDWIIDQPLDPDGAGGNDISREDGYIDLAVIPGEEANKEWHNSDREAIMDLRYLQLESIDIDDIWKPSDQLVLVRGVAGIGKSTLINRYVLKWAKNEILLGAVTDGKIDFLFFFECRELNTMPNLNKIEDLLMEKYPNIFQYLNIQDLRKIADRVMIIVDGLDELQGIYDENPNESIPTTELIKTMISTKSSTFIKGHRTIACGRPKACEFIKSSMLQSQKIKTIEVSGFNEANTMKYIERFFQNDPEKAETVKEIIKRPNIRMMSSVPVFLWVICLLYSEEFDGEINSSTELYTYGLFIFLKKHLRSSRNLGNPSLNQMVTTSEFAGIVYSLAKLSVKTYMSHQVVFTDEDIEDIQCPIHLEQTGFIVRHSPGKFGRRDAYQFKHLAFQEYLCALYLYLAKGVSIFNTSRELTSCTPTILGIHHLAKEQNNDILVAFYKNLLAYFNSSKTFLDIIKTPYRHFVYNRFINRHLDVSDIIRSKSKSLHCDIKNFRFIELVRNYRENGWLVEKQLVKEVKFYKIIVKVDNIWNQEILAFLNLLKVTHIDILYLLNKSIAGFGETDSELIQMTTLNGPLHLHVVSIDYSLYFTYDNFSGMLIKFNKKHTISNVIKESAKMFIIVKDLMKRVPKLISTFGAELQIPNTVENLDNLYHLFADLIEHVLENEGKRLEFEYGLSGGMWNALFTKFRRNFGKKKGFDKIMFYQLPY